MTTLLAADRIAAASSGVALRTLRASSVPPAAAACTWPNAPNSTLVNERFIAFDMLTDRMKPRRAVQRAGNDQQLAVEHESHGRRRKSGIGIQQRDHGRHVSAADGHDQHDAENQRDAHHDRVQLHRSGIAYQLNRDADGHASRTPRLTKFCPL